MRVGKRDGRVVEFELGKIVRAIENAMAETTDGVDSQVAEKIALKVEKEVLKSKEEVIDIEVIQDAVEMALMESNRKDVAKRYILYREERNKQRYTDKGKSKHKFLSEEFLNEYKHKPDTFPHEVGKCVYYRTYSRPLPEQRRRERWWETVARVVDFNVGLQVSAMKRQGKAVTYDIIKKLEEEAMEIYDLMYNLKLFPSGRSLWVNNCPL